MWNEEVQNQRHRTRHIRMVTRQLDVPTSFSIVVYYESLKRELKTKPIYEFRCDERLKFKVEEYTHLTCTLLCAELEHLKTETRLIVDPGSLTPVWF